MRVAITSALAALIGTAFVGLATAQTPKATPKPRTPESIQCSAEANAKGLKGAERRKFRKACIAAAMKKKKAA